MKIGLSLSVCSYFGNATAPNPVQDQNTYSRLRPTASATYYPRDGGRLEYFLGKYWLLGGWNPVNNPEWGTDITTNSVWSSPDLVTWTQELAHDSNPPTSGAGARWRRRHTHKTYVYGGYLWVIGADTSDGAPWPDDVWRSSNGTTWERVSAHSDPGVLYLAIPAVYGGYMHVLGGNEFLTGAAGRKHWRTTDGVTWERLPDMPFDRAAVTNAVVLHNKLFVIGGNSGPSESQATQCNDTWRWDGTTWTRQSASAGWSGMDWIATAAYNDRLWVLTGRAGALNAGTLWYSSDEGVTWTETLPVAHSISHADAITVTEAHGIVIASGNNHGTNVYTIKACPDPSVVMPSLPWNLWFEGANFAITSARVYGKSGAGVNGSASRSCLATNSPGVGTVNGRPAIVLDGTNDVIRYADGGASADLFDPDGWTIVMVGKLPASATNSATPYLNQSFATETSAFMAIALKSAGPSMVAYMDDGVVKQTSPALNYTANALMCVQVKYTGTTLQIRINKGAWSTVACGNVNWTTNFHIGGNYNLTLFNGTTIAEYAVADSAISDANLNLVVDEMASKWGF